MQSSSQIIITNKLTSNFLQARCTSCRPTNSVKALKGKYHIPWSCLAQAHLGVFQLCLWPLIAPWEGLPCLSSAIWCQYPNYLKFCCKIFWKLEQMVSIPVFRWYLGNPAVLSFVKKSTRPCAIITGKKSEFFVWWRNCDGLNAWISSSVLLCIGSWYRLTLTPSHQLVTVLHTVKLI